MGKNKNFGKMILEVIVNDYDKIMVGEHTSDLNKMFRSPHGITMNIKPNKKIAWSTIEYQWGKPDKLMMRWGLKSGKSCLLHYTKERDQWVTRDDITESIQKSYSTKSYVGKSLEKVHKIAKAYWKAFAHEKVGSSLEKVA